MIQSILAAVTGLLLLLIILGVAWQGATLREKR